MSTAAAVLPSVVDLARWDDEICFHEDSYELVEGVPTMAPPESLANRAVGALMLGLLNPHRDGWLAVTDAGLTIREVPRATVRCPDVVVGPAASMRPDASPDMRLEAGEALFVAEVVSPSSIERDLVAKRRDYAQAGVPSYLVIDLRDGRRELTLYEQRDADGLFVDVEPTDRVTVTIAGTAIEVGVDDLLA